MLDVLAGWFGKKSSKTSAGRCEYVSLVGDVCTNEWVSFCCKCGLKLCTEDAYVDPLAFAVSRRDNRYCFDCLPE